MVSTKIVLKTAPSGFEIIASVVKATAGTGNWFAANIELNLPPANLLIAYQAAITVSDTTIVSITFDGATFFPLNNNVALNGYFTFTFLAPFNAEINFKSSGNVNITAIIGIG